MDRDVALAQLPALYGKALTMQEHGADDTEIAEALRLDIEAVGPLLRLGNAKLRELTSDRDASVAAGDTSVTNEAIGQSVRRKKDAP